MSRQKKKYPWAPLCRLVAQVSAPWEKMSPNRIRFQKSIDHARGRGIHFATSPIYCLESELGNYRCHAAAHKRRTLYDSRLTLTVTPMEGYMLQSSPTSYSSSKASRYLTSYATGYADGCAARSKIGRAASSAGNCADNCACQI